jgi:hypothetical protein
MLEERDRVDTGGGIGPEVGCDDDEDVAAEIACGGGGRGGAVALGYADVKLEFTRTFSVPKPSMSM